VSCVTRYPDSTDLPLSSPASKLYNDPLRCARYSITTHLMCCISMWILTCSLSPAHSASPPPCSSVIPLERDVYRFRVLVEEVGDQLMEYVESNTGRWDHGGEIDGENSFGGGSNSSRFCNRSTVRVLVANALRSTAITRVSKPIFPSFLDTRLVSPNSPLPALKAIQMGISRPQIFSPHYQK
jgi:hypothetical protein